MQYHTPTLSMSLKDIYEADRDTLSNYLRQNYTMNMPVTIVTDEDILTAQQLMLRYAAYAITLKGIVDDIQAMKRSATKDKASLLSKERLFKTYADNAEKAHETIWRVLKSKNYVLEEHKLLRTAP